MKTYHPRRFALAILLVLLLISCGGCSNSSGDGGGIGGSGIVSYGSVSGFGSIFVNGTEFDTSGAAVIVEGEIKGVGDATVLDYLDIGKVVTVKGTVNPDGNTATADRVTYNDDVEGPVESIHDIDATTKEIVVLGQTAIVKVHAKFKGTTFDTIAPNDVVEVSGLVDDMGAIWASFLEKTREFTPGVAVAVEVRGFVENLDPDLETFKINDLTVDYSLADTSDLPGGALADGLLVEVKGTLDAIGGEMLAMEIQLENQLGGGNADMVEMTGFVTDFVSVFEFSVWNQVVHTDANTVFIDGTRDDIALGVKLEVEGRLIGGNLYADEIEFWGPDQIEVEGFVTGFVSIFEFTVGSQVVHTDGNTVFDGGAPEDIALGVKLEVKGKLEGNILVADKVSFESV